MQRMVVNVRTAASNKLVQELMFKLGYRWAGREEFEPLHYGENTCINISNEGHRLSYSRAKFYEEDGYKIISVHEFVHNVYPNLEVEAASGKS